MTTPAERAIDALAEAAELAHELGVLHEALDGLPGRLNTPDAGGVLDAWVREHCDCASCIAWRKWR